VQELFNELWWLYNNHLCHKKKGAKPPALKAFEKIYKSGGEEEVKRIIENTKALIRHDLDELKHGGRPDRWPHVSTYLNQGYYDREIESYEKLKERSPIICRCGNQSHARGLCLDCLLKDDPKEKERLSTLRSSWRRVTELIPRKDGETTAEYARRAFKELGGRL